MPDADPEHVVRAWPAPRTRLGSPYSGGQDVTTAARRSTTSTARSNPVAAKRARRRSSETTTTSSPPPWRARPGGPEQHAEPGVVEHVDAVEVDGHPAPRVVADEPEQRAGELRHRRQVDRARQRDDGQRPDDVVASPQVHPARVPAAARRPDQGTAARRPSSPSPAARRRR